MKQKKKKITSKVKKKQNRKKDKRKTSKKSKVVMIKSSQKNIIKRAKILEKVDPIIMNVSSSDKNAIKKTESKKFSKRYNLYKKKTTMNNIHKIIFRTKSNNIINITKEEIENNKGWAILSYICAPYVFLMKKDSSYVKYHTNKGMKIFYIEVIYLILYYLTKNKIKAPTSCDNFAHYNFSEICMATPWWVNFIWAIIALIIIFNIVKFIKIVLTEKEMTEEVLN